MEVATSIARAGLSWRSVAFLASAAAGAVHLGAVHAHLMSYPPAGAFMLVAGSAQVVWALWVARGAPSWVVRAGSIGNLAIVWVWLVSRTAGLPWGPMPWTPEHVHPTDALATGLELLVAAAAFHLTLSEPARPGRVPVALALAGVALATVAGTHEPARERIVAVAAIALALVTRAYLSAVAGPMPAARTPRGSHVQVASVPGRGARLGPDLGAGVGARG